MLTAWLWSVQKTRGIENEEGAEKQIFSAIAQAQFGTGYYKLE